MKNTIAQFLIAFLILGLVSALGYSIYDNDRLNNVIDNQNAFIKNITGKQSDFDKESKKYRDSIISYTKEITYLLNGKELSSEDFIKAYDKVRNERDSLNSLFNYARKLYGFDVRRKYTNDSTYTLYQHGISKADSSKIALESFRDRLTIKKGMWHIDKTGKKDLDDYEKEINKKLRPALDSSKKILEKYKQ